MSEYSCCKCNETHHCSELHTIDGRDDLGVLCDSCYFEYIKSLLKEKHGQKIT
jgi:hypothetical protein